MDPDAALADLLTDILNGDADAAAESARNLAEWIARDGFAPAVAPIVHRLRIQAGVR